MNYRNRWIIESPVGFSEREYLVASSKILIASERLSLNGIYIVDILNDHEDINEAFLSSRQIVSEFVEACAYLGYGLSRIVKYVGSYPKDYLIMDKFELLVVGNIAQTINKNEIAATDLNLFFSSKNGGFGDPLTSIAKGLMAQTITDKVIMLHSGIESIAKIEATEYVYSECQKCKARVSSGRKATKNYIKTIMEESLEAGKKLYADFDQLRNKVGHGDHFSSIHEFEAARKTTAAVQGSFVFLLDARIGFSRKSNAQLFVSYPSMIFTVTRGGEAMNIQMKNSSQTSEISVVQGKEKVKPNDVVFRMGFLGSVDEMLPKEFVEMLFSLPQEG